jgi:lysine 6-dehydrogenase
MAKAVVLGAGMVGSTMAWDMRRQGYEVTVVDARPDALERAQRLCDVSVIRADLTDPAVLAATVRPFDVVLGALSSKIGLLTMRSVIEAKKNYVDISFMAEDAWQLDALAKEHGITVVFDIGVGPGMSNVLIGHMVGRMTPCERIEILVAGLPIVRSWPYQYKAPFAASDVIEEYVRPARIVEHGRIVIKEALSEPELIEFPGIGTLEAFNTDGLRSLAHTLDVPHMRERTMRYPGHIELMRVLRETGLFSSVPIDVGGVSVAPLDVTAKLLFPKWAFAEGEEELTVMRVMAEGLENGVRTRRTWDLLDRYDAATGFRSMSRTTGFPATIAADLVARGVFAMPGVHPPEVLGRVDGLRDHFLSELAARGVKFTETVERL